MVSHGTRTPVSWVEVLDLVEQPPPHPSLFCGPCGFSFGPEEFHTNFSAFRAVNEDSMHQYTLGLSLHTESASCLSLYASPQVLSSPRWKVVLKQWNQQLMVNTLAQYWGNSFIYSHLWLQYVSILIVSIGQVEIAAQTINCCPQSSKSTECWIINTW